MSQKINQVYEIAREQYAAIGVDTEKVLTALDAIPISIQCWQGDDVIGFESGAGALTGGIQTSGNYPGRARTPQELRADLELALSLIPGKKRVNLHAIYLDAKEAVAREDIEPKHFATWVEWAKKHDLGLDYNPTCFSHPNSADGLTLSHPNASIRKFWVDHCIGSRKISEYFGKELGTPAVMNVWVPDGLKDEPADRLTPRKRLIESLDAILAGTNGTHHKVAVEGKLFGIGAESYTVGSNEFYAAYAATRKVLLTLDAGHFHPTENVGDKISTAFCFGDEILLHVSRPVRWDSDHVVLLDDPTQTIADEIIRCGVHRINIGLDFFDASINRIAAWTVGSRNMRKALLRALLAPQQKLAEFQEKFDFSARLAWSEELKSLPWTAVWQHYCESRNVPTGIEWFDKVRAYEAEVASKRA
ncbi:L-rhamnose isomerase [Telmatobacter bradus]|uniref:L-rhamnose isomerase n=1 Tax=Telmatobacter bradus TaxID=474953 RepID=UPI003B42EDAC